MEPVEWGEHIVSGFVLITKDNMDTYSSEIEQLSIDIANDLETVYMKK